MSGDDVAVAALLERMEELLAENMGLRESVATLTADAKNDQAKYYTSEKERHSLQVSLLKLTVKASDMDRTIRKGQHERNALVTQLMKYSSQAMRDIV